MNLNELFDQKYLTITSLGTDGTPCQTSALFVPDADSIVILIPAAQVRSVVGTGCVTLAPCSVRGRQVGPDFFGDISVLDTHRTRHARNRLVTRYGVVAKALTACVEDLVGIRIHVDLAVARCRTSANPTGSVTEHGISGTRSHY